MELRDFSYEIPPDRVAQAPLAERSASRLLALDGRGGTYRDLRMRDLPRLMQPGDLLVFNDTRVITARLLGKKYSGGRVEILLERTLEGNRALVQLKDSKTLRPGMGIATAGGDVRILERCGELWSVDFPSEPAEFFEKWGAVPLPPYIKRAPEPNDRERYQS